jgi:YVTN family beta-propeller protein
VPTADSQLPPQVVWADPARTSIDHAVLMNGRRIQPRGRWLPLGTLCTAAAARPGHPREVAALCNGEMDSQLADPAHQSIRVVDVEGFTQQIIERPSLFYGLAWSPDGARLYASAGQGTTVEVFDAADGYKLRASYPTRGTVTYGIAVTPDGASVLATESHAQSVVQLDAATGAVLRRFEVGTYPYAIVVTPDGARAYVSCLAEGGVFVLDLASGKTLGYLATGKNPEGLALAADGMLYVANSDADSISVIDTATDTVVATRDLRADPLIPGVGPAGVSISADGDRLYVPCSGDGAVRVLRRAGLEEIGAVQGGDFVQDALETDGRLLILSGKGLNTLLDPGLGDYDPAGQQQVEHHTVLDHRGALQVIDPIPDDATLAAWVDEVAAGLAAPAAEYDWPCTDPANPLPRDYGTASERIRHVVYIVKENKTYDSLLGDLVGPEGDDWHHPAYALFGEAVPAAVVPLQYAGQQLNVTPNLHALARGFCNLVNFYNNADRSTQGHQWSTSGRLNDFFEKAVWLVQDGPQFSIPGVDAVTRPDGGNLVDDLVAQGRTVRIYGEFASFAGHIADYEEGGWVSYALDFPMGMNEIPDFVKVKAFQRDVGAGLLRDFTYIQLMNDHTYGFSDGRPHPAYMVADGDYAVGLVVEAVAATPFWDSTAIFILEDDPQDVPDHIDSHRSLLLVAGGPVKRGHTSRVRYDYPSLHATALRALGAAPMNRFDAEAPAMWDCFTDAPSPSGYTARPMDAKLAHKWEWMVGQFEVAPPVTALYHRLVQASAGLDLEDVDRALGMGPILWGGHQGDDRPVPGPLPLPTALRAPRLNPQRAGR